MTMNKYLKNFLNLSEERHMLTLENKIVKHNQLVKKMVLLEEEVSNDELIRAVKEENLNDWQKVDIAAKLLKRKQKKAAVIIFEELKNSQDSFTKADVYTYLSIIIPQLEKEGEI